MDIKIIIGCDADGVLTNLITHNIREGEKVFKRKAINTNEYDLEKIFDLKDLSTVTKYAKAFQIYENYCKNEEPREDVSEVINELTNNGCEFHQITARKFATANNFLGRRYRKLLKLWNEKHDIKFKSYKFCSEHDVATKKLIECKKLGTDIMIEDNLEIATLLAKNGIKVLLVDAPYNKSVPIENVTRIHNWMEIKEEIYKYKEEKSKIVNNFIETPFKKLEKEEINKLSNLEKKQYFIKYKEYLQDNKIDDKSFEKGEKRFRRIYKLIKLPAKAALKIKVVDKKNVPYENGFIVASNHIDSKDQYMVGLAIGNKPFTGLAASTIENTLRGKMFKYTNGAIFVDRKDENSRKESSEELAIRVAHGKTAMIFPEGTRKNKDEEGKTKYQLPFKLGVVSTSQKTGAPILPVAINHFDNYSQIKIGKAFVVNPEDDLIEANKKLENIVATLSWENMEDNLNKDKDKKEINKVYRKVNKLR